MHSDWKQPNSLEKYLEAVFRVSRERRAAAENAKADITAAERFLKRRAIEEMETGRIRHYGACGVPEVLLEGLRRGGWETTRALDGVYRWLAGDQPFLVLTGGAGSGKSFAAASTLSQAKRTLKTYAHPLAEEPMELEEYDSGAGLFVTASQLRMASRFVERGPSLLDRAATVAWLVLDELRQADFAGAGLERFEELLGERYARRLRTVITTNLGAEELGKHLGERLASRFAEGAMAWNAGEADMRRIK